MKRIKPPGPALTALQKKQNRLTVIYLVHSVRRAFTSSIFDVASWNLAFHKLIFLSHPNLRMHFGVEGDKELSQQNLVGEKSEAKQKGRKINFGTHLLSKLGAKLIMTFKLNGGFLCLV